VPGDDHLAQIRVQGCRRKFALPNIFTHVRALRSGV
jgi:hypothetical protein